MKLSLLTYLHYIIQGWWNLFLDWISDIKYKKEFDERLKICNSCSYNKHGICQKCYCVVAAKTKSEDSKCPLDKWRTIKETLQNR